MSHVTTPNPAISPPSRQTDTEFQGDRARRAFITLAACSTLAPSSGRLGLAPETYLAPLDKLYWAVVAKGDVQFDGALELVVAKPHYRGNHVTWTSAFLKKYFRLLQVKAGDCASHRRHHFWHFRYT